MVTVAPHILAAGIRHWLDEAATPRPLDERQRAEANAVLLGGARYYLAEVLEHLDTMEVDG